MRFPMLYHRICITSGLCAIIANLAASASVDFLTMLTELFGKSFFSLLAGKASVFVFVFALVFVCKNYHYKLLT